MLYRSHLALAEHVGRFQVRLGPVKKPKGCRTIIFVRDILGRLGLFGHARTHELKFSVYSCFSGLGMQSAMFAKGVNKPIRAIVIVGSIVGSSGPGYRKYRCYRCFLSLTGGGRGTGIQRSLKL